jgi:hypothetical protein
MALIPGTRLGSYAVLSAIGAGPSTRRGSSKGGWKGPAEGARDFIRYSDKIQVPPGCSEMPGSAFLLSTAGA